jgi:hypothetical protein
MCACRDVVRRLYPDLFNHELSNPWRGVALSWRTKLVKSAATRQEVYIFAETAIAAGYPEVGAGAVICFEWLQRPENVLAGYIRWTDYRAATRRAPSESHTTRLAQSSSIRSGRGWHALLCRRRGRPSRRYRGAASPSSYTMLAPGPRKAKRNPPAPFGKRHGKTGPAACAKSPICPRPSAWTLAATAA